MSQQGKVALVTGGARGIGRSFVEHLLKEGAKVSICDIIKDIGEATAAELSKSYPGNVIFFECDVANDKQFEECVKRTIETFNGLHILINNAGIAEEWTVPYRNVIDVNLNGVICGTKLGFDYMSREKGGLGGIIVNIASLSSFLPFPITPIYSATKAAINQLTRSYGHELYHKKSQVKIIAINPGLTDTAILLKNAKFGEIFSEHIDRVAVMLRNYCIQSPNSMGKGLIHILKNTENGALWAIQNDEPPELITVPSNIVKKKKENL